MQLIQYEVRTDWLEYERRKTAENNRFWHLVLGLVGLSMIAMLVIRTARLESHTTLILSILCSSTLYLSVPLLKVYPVHKQGIRFTAVTLALVAGLAVMSGLVYPLSMAGIPIPLAIVAVLIPIVGYWLFKWVHREVPAVLRQTGFLLERWQVNLLIGGLVGGTVGLHFLITNHFFFGPWMPIADWLPAVVWVFFFQVGYAALGEELLLRGLCFQLLYDESQNNLTQAALKISALSLLMVFLPLLPPANPALWVGFLIYRFVCSYLAVLLRFRRGSLIPGYALNVVAQTLMAVVLL